MRIKIVLKGRPFRRVEIIDCTKYGWSPDSGLHLYDKDLYRPSTFISADDIVRFDVEVISDDKV